MKNKQIVLSVFIFFVFILYGLNPFSNSNPAPGRAMGLYGQDVDLVKLKQQEEERRKNTKKSKYVVTNDNLDKIETPEKSHSVIKLEGKGTEETATKAGDDSSSSSSESVETTAGNRQSKEYWQARVNKLLADMDRTKADIKHTQMELNQLFNKWLGNPGPGPHLEEEREMASLKKHIKDAKKKLDDLKKSMEDLEDQARKESIPAGWLRVDRPEPTMDQ